MHNKEYSKEYINSISNNFNVQSSPLGSRVFVFHNQIIIKQIKLLCISKPLSLLLRVCTCISNIVSLSGYQFCVTSRALRSYNGKPKR